MFRRSITLVLAWLCLLLAGCSDSRDNFVFNSTGSNTVSNNFQLRSNVEVLDSGVTVVSITDTEVTLSGSVPQLAPGQVIIKNDGPQTFTRTVVSVSVQGANIVVTTSAATIPDIFESADIRQVEVVDPAVLAKLVPNLPGITIGTAESLGRVDSTLLPTDGAIQIRFENTRLYDQTNGETYAQLDGVLNVTVGFEKILQTENDLVQITPFSRVTGNVAVKSLTNERQNHTLYLTNALSIPLEKVGEMPVTGTVHLSLDLQGDIEKNGILRFDVPSEGNFIQTGTGIDLSTGLRRDPALQFISNWTAPVPFLPTGGLLNIKGSLCTVESAVVYAGVEDIRGEAWRMPLMPFVADTALTSEAVSGETQRGYRVTVRQDPRPPAGFDILDVNPTNPLALADRQTRIDLGPFSGDGRTLVTNFTPIFNQGYPRETRLDPEPETPVEIRVGESFFVSARGDFSDSGGFAPNAPILARWSFLDGTIEDHVAISTAEGTVVRFTGLTPGSNILEMAAGQSEGVRDMFVNVLPQTPTALRIFGGNNGQFLTGSAAEQWRLTQFEQTLSARLIYSDDQARPVTEDATWSTSNPEIAEITAPGVVQLKRPGRVEIRASHLGFEAIKTVDILPPQVLGIDLVPSPPTLLRPGAIHQFSALAGFSDGSVREITTLADWFSTRTSVAEVDEFGVATGIKTGLAHAVASYLGAAGVQALYVGEPPVTALTLTPNPVTVNPGESSQVTVRATFADGTFGDVTNQARYFTSGSDPNFSVSDQGVVTGLTPGNGGLFVEFSNGVRAVQVTVNRGSLEVTTPPPASVDTTTPFTVSGRVLDAAGILQTGFNGTVQVTLAANPSQGALSGTTQVQAVGGLFTFNNLSINLAGAGYRLALQAPGLASALTGPFTVTGTTPPPPAALGFLYAVNNSSLSPGVASFEIEGGVDEGDLTQISGSPKATSGRVKDIVRLGDFLYSGALNSTSGESALDIFTIDTVTGGLTLGTSYDINVEHFNGPVHLSHNGVNAVFAATEFSSTLSAMLVDSAGGTVSQQADEVLPGLGFPRAVAVLPGAESDLVFVADAGNNDSNIVHVYGYNRSVNPPTLNFIGSTNNTAGGTPSGMTVFGNRLYVSNVNLMNSSITRFDVDTANGTLINQAIAHQYTGIKGPRSLLFVTHPTLGQLAVASNNSAASLSTFQVATNGDLTQLFETATNEASPKALLSFSSNGLVYLVTSLSNSLQVFVLSSTTGEPSNVFVTTEVASPVGLTR